MTKLNEYDIIIIGAGAAGLSAAMELTKAGRKVLVLEARNRIGGRIYTIEDDQFTQPIEAGAEFIHGQLPLTTSFLKKAAIKYNTIGSKIWNVTNGKVEEEQQFIKDWDVLMKALHELKQDQTISDFLQTHFSDDKYRELRETTLQYVQGYNAAHPEKASAMALKEEWEAEDEENQFRVQGGYQQLIDYFYNEVTRTGGDILLSSPVTNIKWKKHEVEVITTAHKSYYSRQVLVTIPLGVLQSQEGNEANINFSPALPEKNAAIKGMGFGSALKIHLQFSGNLWEHKSLKHPMKQATFIFSDAFIPTWWTQYPNNNGLLTGWLAGPKATKLQNTTDDLIYEKVLESLSYIFTLEKTKLLQEIQACKIHNWAAQPFSCGAYSYATLHTAKAIQTLSQPEDDTIFFAGEALTTGPMTGTVEAALFSGTETARNLIANRPNPLPHK